jgi:hypothetical protein
VHERLSEQLLVNVVLAGAEHSDCSEDGPIVSTLATGVAHHAGSTEPIRLLAKLSELRQSNPLKAPALMTVSRFPDKSNTVIVPELIFEKAFTATSLMLFLDSNNCSRAANGAGNISTLIRENSFLARLKILSHGCFA